MVYKLFVNKKILFLLFILTLTMIFYGCADQSGSEETANQNNETNETNEGTDDSDTDEPIKIGGTLPLTGPYAETGLYIYDGYQHWVKEINENGGLLGRQVELEILDDQSDQSNAVSLLQNVITQQNVDLIIGGYPGDTAAAQMNVAEQHELVYISMGGHMTSFEQGYTYSFGAPPLMGEWWYHSFFEWLKTIPEDERPTKAAMITVNNPVGNAVRGSTIEGLEELNIELVVDEFYELPLSSAEPLVNKAKQAGADLFFANGFFGDGVQTMRVIRALDYQPKAILQGIGTLIPSWEEELGEEGNYVFSGTAMHPTLPFEGVDELNKVSQELYGTDAPPYFMFGYAWMQVLGQAVEGVGTIDHEKMRDWLRENAVETVGGRFTFDEKGLPEPYSYLTQVINGEAKLVWPEEVATEELVYPHPFN